MRGTEERGLRHRGTSSSTPRNEAFGTEIRFTPIASIHYILQMSAPAEDAYYMGDSISRKRTVSLLKK